MKMLAVMGMKLCLRPDQDFEPPLPQAASAKQFISGPLCFGQNNYTFIVRQALYGGTRDARFSQMKWEETGDGVAVFHDPHKDIVPRGSHSLSEFRA
jgi:hypothetical protein